MKIIARVKCDFKEKFGIPRQSGIADGVVGKIVFEKEYRQREALRGIEGYSHLWLLWQFSEAISDKFSPSVRPPRLGGNERVGVFATRSPFRPNPIGLSSVRLLEVREDGENGAVLIVGGIDLLDGTPIYDIKPYLAYTDSHPEAKGGFADSVKDYALPVVLPDELARGIDEDTLATVKQLLAHDPRPSYVKDGEREYGFKFAELEIFFRVEDGVLTVTRIEGI
jgi:tRNA-Thr(GGU) m(6)t(6)A37 methyltransferase TsaA